ncbi:hypothetical protein GUJ93_ZPchr0005g15010 [Zizania palustris]|uniref:Uncharacterized protein n=1 Tax=Zizania palustris TaxID=103762 RepID=A0A8J5SCW7_ZIZPA|nr:hypothetical protein GUJ93_ZPchr0005g15010 [Zizania palustris]
MGESSAYSKVAKSPPKSLSRACNPSESKPAKVGSGATASTSLCFRPRALDLHAIFKGFNSRRDFDVHGLREIPRRLRSLRRARGTPRRRTP